MCVSLKEERINTFYHLFNTVSFFLWDYIFFQQEHNEIIKNDRKYISNIIKCLLY